jgi:hypothetical protein
MPRFVFTPAPENPPVDFSTAINAPGFYSIAPDQPPTILSFGNGAFVLALSPTDGTIVNFFTPGQPPEATNFYLRRGSGTYTP